MDEKDYRLVKIFKALGNGIRFNILLELLNSSSYVQNLAEKFERSASSISSHLRVLRNLDLVQFKTEGNRVRYTTKRTQIIEKIMELRSEVRREEEEE